MFGARCWACGGDAGRARGRSFQGSSGRSEARRRQSLLAGRWRRNVRVEQLDHLTLVVDVGRINLAIDREMAAWGGTHAGAVAGIRQRYHNVGDDLELEVGRDDGCVVGHLSLRRSGRVILHHLVEGDAVEDGRERAFQHERRDGYDQTSSSGFAHLSIGTRRRQAGIRAKLRG